MPVALHCAVLVSFGFASLSIADKLQGRALRWRYNLVVALVGANIGQIVIWIVLQLLK
jgi:hypothetical protein